MLALPQCVNFKPSLIDSVVTYHVFIAHAPDVILTTLTDIRIY